MSLYIDELEIDVDHSSATDTVETYVFDDNGEVKVVVIGRSHDEDCGNPLTDCDGEGHIHWHPKHRRYGTRDSGYYEALGFDREGEPDYSLDVVQNVLLQKGFARLVADRSLMAKLRHKRREHGNLATNASIFNDLQQLCDNGGLTSAYWISRIFFGKSNSTLEAVVEPVALIFDDEDLQQEAWQESHPGDVDAVLLDCYEHSGIALSVHGTGMQCQFDTSRGAAVWVPDDCARDEIVRRGVVYAFGQISELRFRGPRNLRFHASFTKTGESASFAEWHEAFSWLETKAELPPIITVQNACIAVDPADRRDYILDCNGVRFSSHSEAYAYRNTLIAERLNDPEALAKGRYSAAVELARGAVELYNSWANGDCWVVSVEEFDAEGEKLEADHCGGFIGYEAADQEIADKLAYYKKTYSAAVIAEEV